MAEDLRPIEEIRQDKIKKLNAIRELKINPYPALPRFTRELIADARTKKPDTNVSVAGRIRSIRTHGGITFADLVDASGKLQLAFKLDALSPELIKLFSLIDQSDYIEATGQLFTTHAGELTVNVTDFSLLAKAIRPVPDKDNQITDKEIRLRKRYLDILTNPTSKEVFRIRHLIARGIRHFLDNQGLIEVETPVLQPLYGGANAKPFTTHINALDAEAYLRIAPELYLKRMVVAGYEGVYELAKDFRNEGVDQTHFPEFTMLEAYLSYTDYQGMMGVMETMLKHLSQDIFGTTKISVNDQAIDLAGEWRRVPLAELIKEKLAIDAESFDHAALIEFAQKHHLEVTSTMPKGELVFVIFDKLISHTLIEPTWVIDYPLEVSPLSKLHRDKPGFTERFELYIGGVELMDGWSELTDPLEQRKRFEAENYRQFSAHETAQPIDEDFIEAMEYGMPPFAGVGMGIDRLTMFFSNTWSIQETILFPYKKPQHQVANESKLEYTVDKTFQIDPVLKAKLPDMFFAYTKIHGVSISKTNPELEQVKQKVVNQAQTISLDHIRTLASIKSYRSIIKLGGSDPHSHLPSPEALLRRIIQGKDLYNINTAVDAYNLAVIESGIGLGGFDATKIAEPVTLRLSQEGETVTLLGDSEISVLKADQIVYADKEKILTVDLNYRDNDQTKITNETTEIILFADGGPGIDKQEVLGALQYGAELILEFCGGTQDKLFLVE